MRGKCEIVQPEQGEGLLIGLQAAQLALKLLGFFCRQHVLQEHDVVVV